MLFVEPVLEYFVLPLNLPDHRIRVNFRGSGKKNNLKIHALQFLKKQAQGGPKAKNVGLFIIIYNCFIQVKHNCIFILRLDRRQEWSRGHLQVPP